MDTEKLHKDILANLASDTTAQKHLGDTSDPKWTTTSDGFLRLDDKIYVPDVEDLRLRVLQSKHDHILSGHFGINKPLGLIRRDYDWPGISVTTSCNTNSDLRIPVLFLGRTLILLRDSIPSPPLVRPCISHFRSSDLTLFT